MLANGPEENPEIEGAVLSQFCNNLEEARQVIEDSYYVCYQPLADYTEELTTSTSEVPEHLSYYIDYDRMGRDMEMSSDIFTVETAHNEVHVFLSC